MDAYRTNGTCSRQILYEVDSNDVLVDVKFLGGCAGGLQAISKFTKGRKIDEVIKMCEGIRCKNDTSCPDQLAKALKDFIKRREDERNGLTPARRGHPQVLKLN